MCTGAEIGNLRLGTSKNHSTIIIFEECEKNQKNDVYLDSERTLRMSTKPSLLCPRLAL